MAEDRRRARGSWLALKAASAACFNPPFSLSFSNILIFGAHSTSWIFIGDVTTVFFAETVMGGSTAGAITGPCGSVRIGIRG